MGSMPDMLPPTIAPDSEDKKDENDNYRYGGGNRSDGKRPSKPDERAVERSDMKWGLLPLWGAGGSWHDTRNNGWECRCYRYKTRCARYIYNRGGNNVRGSRNQRCCECIPSGTGGSRARLGLKGVVDADQTVIGCAK